MSAPPHSLRRVGRCDFSEKKATPTALALDSRQNTMVNSAASSVKPTGSTSRGPSAPPSHPTSRPLILVNSPLKDTQRPINVPPPLSAPNPSLSSRHPPLCKPAVPSNHPQTSPSTTSKAAPGTRPPAIASSPPATNKLTKNAAAKPPAPSFSSTHPPIAAKPHGPSQGWPVNTTASSPSLKSPPKVHPLAVPNPSIKGAKAPVNTATPTGAPKSSSPLDRAKPNPLDADFPEVSQILAPLRRARSKNEVDSFCSLGRSFQRKINRAAKLIDSQPFIDRTHPRFILARAALMLLISTLSFDMTTLENRASLPLDVPTQLDIVEKSAYTTYDSLSLFYCICLAFAKNKPLPDLPAFILRKTFEEPISSNPSEDEDDIRESFVLVQNDFMEPTKKPCWKIRWNCQKKDSDARSLFSTKTQNTESKSSTTTLVDTASSRRQDSKRPEAIYNQRLTLLHFEPTQEKLRLAGELAEGKEGLIFDSRNNVTAGSLTALVRLLTSKGSEQNPELCGTIFSCFRLFTTPKDFLEELVSRFETRSPDGGSAHERDASASEIRFRVLAVLYSWLDQHWDVESDFPVLWRIRAFVRSLQGSKLVDGAVLASLCSKIDERENCTVEDLRMRQLKEMSESSAMRPRMLKKTNFVFPKTFPTSLSGFSVLDSKAGREEVARHFTLMLSSLFSKLNPTDVVTFWLQVGDKAHQYDKYKNVPTACALKEISDYGERLTMLIILSIVNPTSMKERARMIYFWVDVGLVCRLIRLPLLSTYAALIL